MIENEFVDIKFDNIEFPENKRNLIYIFLESMETTYYSKDNGGAYNESLIKELENLAVNNISFSTNDTFQGSYTLPGTTWTSGAMTAQTTGIPLKIAINGNMYGINRKFLPGAITLGEILEKQGYNQMIMVGSDIEYGGRKSLFCSHANYEVWDVNTAIEQERMTEKDKVWWGFSDNDLIKYAKEQITELSKKEEPFNFTMLTADTHHIDGYLCDDCDNRFENQYENVIACSSKRIFEFVEWIKEQEFYENTTIVIAGDHLSMQNDFFQEIEDSWNVRKTINIFINSPIQPVETKNRGNSTLDMLPTTLASLGAKIKGNRLGLGTNLFSEEKTLLQKYDVDYVWKELTKNSSFYNEKFIYNK